MRASVVAAALCLATAATAQPARQPDLVCDLAPVLTGTIEDGRWRTPGPAGDPVRLTFATRTRGPVAQP